MTNEPAWSANTNTYQAVNNAASFPMLPALAVGLGRASDHPLSPWLFVVFVVLVRVKIFFDDHRYFERPETGKRHFKAGFLIGVLSWVPWIAGAGQVDIARKTAWRSQVDRSDT